MRPHAGTIALAFPADVRGGVRRPGAIPSKSTAASRFRIPAESLPILLDLLLLPEFDATTANGCRYAR